MFMSMFGATTLHGVSWSSYANCPRQARRYFIVDRLGRPRGSWRLPSRVNFGKLWPSCHFSTSICQSVSSTDVT